MKRYLDQLLPAVIIAVISWSLYASSQGVNSPGSRVTVTNPLNVTLTNSPALQVTITNSVGGPAIVTCENCGSGGSYFVTATNTINVGPSLVTLANTSGFPGIVTCTNCGSGRADFVTITNVVQPPSIVTIANIGANPVIGIVTLANTATVPAIVNMTNAAFQITNTNSVISPSNMGLVVSGAASGGLTVLTGYNQLTTTNSLKTTAGKLYKVVCLNPNVTRVYLEVFNLTPLSVQQQILSAARGASTAAKPALAYGIPSSSNIVVNSETGDQFTVAMTAVSTLTIGGGLPPSTGIDCTFSIN